MSAFLCNPDHIAVLACYSGGPIEEMQLRAAQLAKGNLLSVGYRYPDTEPARDFLGLDTDEIYIEECKDAVLTWAGKIRPDPVTILSMARCSDYQSCERPDWPQMDGYRVLQRIQSEALHRLPGWDEAPWEFHPERHSLRLVRAS